MDPIGATRTGPTRPQLALALALLKQKPAGKEVKDYILGVRECIKAAKDPAFTTQDKFFDSVAFWQKAYKESEAEQTKLLNTIHELEQRNQGLQARLRGQPSTFNDDQLSNKRKASDKIENADRQEPAKNGTRKTGAKRHAAGPGHEAKKGGPLTTKQEHDSGGLLRQVYILQRALQKKNNSSCLTAETVILCKETESELLEAVQRQNLSSNPQAAPRNNQDKKPDLTTVVKGLEISFHLIHQALHKVRDGEQYEGHKDRIIYYIVCLFESTMTALTQHCNFIATYENTDRTDTRQMSSNRKTTGPKGKAKGQNGPLFTPRLIVAEHLTNALCTMVLSLDFSRDEDEKVFEGFLFIVLNRVGKFLSLFTFKSLQLPSTCPELMPPDGLMAMNQDASPPQGIELEAKHIITLLDRVLTHSSTRTTENTAMRSDFIQKTRCRLQKTLLQAVFGNDDPAFEDGLRFPANPPPQSHKKQPTDQTPIPEWFTQELWRLVGWDLLQSMTSGPK